MSKVNANGANLTGIDPFQGWAEASAKAKRPLSVQSIQKYESLWNSWRKWLLSNHVSWEAVTSDEIQKFLNGPAPGQGGTNKPRNAAKMASYSRQRYWRLLRGVYFHAVKTGRLATNPTLDVPDDDRPSVAEVDRQSQILEPFIFDRLSDPATIKSTIKVSSEDDWWHIRDRALIAVLVATGITSAEAIALRGCDVCIKGRASQSQSLPLPFAPEEPVRIVVDVMQSSESVGRTLEIGPQLAGIVLEWMRRRQRILNQRSAYAAEGDKRRLWLELHDRNGPFFVARRSKSIDKGASSALPPLEHVTLYYAVSQALKKLRGESTGRGQNVGSKLAKGPAVIRNSVIRRWLDSLGVDKTVELAGLRSADSLRLRGGVDTPHE